MTLLRDEEWSGLSDREIARRCRVHKNLVNRLRADSSGPKGQIAERKVRRGDQVYTQKTDGINRDRPKREPAPDSPDDLVPWPTKPEAVAAAWRYPSGSRGDAMADRERFLTPTEFAFEFGVSERTVRRMLARGDLVHRDTNARGRYRKALIPESELSRVEKFDPNVTPIRRPGTVRGQPEFDGGTRGGSAESLDSRSAGFSRRGR